MASSIRNARNVLAVSFFMRSKLFASRRAQGRLELWRKANFCCSCRRLWRQNRCVTIPIALTIAGSDSSAGAGIQADLKTFSVLGVYGVSAVTCVVAEIPGKVSRIEPISVEMVREQIEVLATSFPIAAIKTGLLCSAAIISAVAESIADLRHRIPLVVDPVITATGGDPLLEPGAIETYQRELFPIAALITPNLDEAAQLLGDKIQDRESMKRAGKEFERKFKTAILLKGGHLRGDEAVDLLFANGKVVEFAAPFVRDVATHGTGCTYSAAITAGLAAGMPLPNSISRAKKFVTGCIANHLRWKSNTGGNIDALNHSP
jgi:hydroxymethylpyrimidine/phosphomethylpyrimidine kinase